jgi:microcystin degradation protein MlrC
LCRALLGNIRPVTAWRTLPLVLGGGTNLDFLPPMLGLYRWMNRIERDPRVLYASLFNCHLWLDDPELGWASSMVVDGDRALAEDLAEQLAERAWQVRKVPPPAFPGASEAIRQARAARLARSLGTVCMSDASDMVGAGGTGENTGLLQAFLSEGKDLRTLLPLRDPEVVAALQTVQPGEPVDVEVGGKLDPKSNPAVRVRGVLRSYHTTPSFGRVAVVQVGRLSLCLTEGAALVMQPRFYGDLGLSPWRADVVVVKSLFPFRLYFALENRKTIYAKTRGVTDLDAGLNAIRFTDPVWPRDPVEDWRATDRRRRGVEPG